jgi:acetyltransferase-like isoleucine patch superfamily enzyme
MRNIILRLITSLEGGMFYSGTLRDIFKKYHNIEIGMYSYGGCFSLDNVVPGTKIGRYCSFASHFCILSGNHPLKFKSLHPFFYNPDLGYVEKLLITRTNLTIENDVWIGRNAIILPSVSRIENGAVIAAGSVVTKNVSAFSVVGGNPARVIKYRFDPNVIRMIVESAWWNRDINDLKKDNLEFPSFLKKIQ